jgi:acetylornithine/succinyldiaminopimelate/putrescine aminotransferase
MPGVGLVMAEPIQGRGGMHTAPSGWLASVAEVTRSHGALLALDEIQTGMGRTGDWFAGPTEGVIPDLMCVGKALGGGFPISACMGTPEVMNAWGASTGEALHTQTFLGHPIGCAAALASIDVLEAGGLTQIQHTSSALSTALTSAGLPVRGRGLMRAVSVGCDALALCRALLRAGFICLPAGAQDISLTPPMCLTQAQIEAFRDALLAERACA